MKQNLISFAAITAVLFAAVSCQVAGTPEVNDEPQNPNFIITTGQPDTKTYFEKEGETYKSYWKGDETQGTGQGDMIRVYVDSNMGNQYRYDNKAENGAAARFEFGQTVVGDAMSLVEDQEYTLYGFHRNGRAIQKWNTGEGATTTTVAVEMLATQNPVSTSNPAATGPDGSSDFLIMKPVKFTYNSKVPATIETQFARISSVLRVKFVDKTGGKYDGYLVKNISIESQNYNLAGPAIVDLCENGGFLEHAILDQVGSKTASKKITVNYNGSILATDGEMFFDMVPETYENETFIITANLYNPEGGVAVISKSFKLETLAFKPGLITSLNLSVKDENITFAEFEGDGTNASPYLIYNEYDLRRLSELTNGVDAASWNGLVYKQMEDITLSDDNFAPICGGTGYFWGTYNGNDKKISNLHITETGDVSNIGLFGTISSSKTNNGSNVSANYGRVMKLTLENPVISTSGQCNFVAALVGLARGGKIDRCTVTGALVSKTKNPATAFILGGTPNNSSTVPETTVVGCVAMNSSFSLTVGNNFAGTAAIVGRTGNKLTISGCLVSNCTIQTNTNSTGNGGISAILGYVNAANNSISISGCTVSKTVIESTSNFVGGVIGYLDSTNPVSVSGCVIGSGCTLSTTQTSVGGIIGGITAKAANVTLDGCAVYAKSITTGNAQAGGIIGGATQATSNAGGTLVISNCCTIGTEMKCTNTTTTNRYIGGIVGRGGFITSGTGYNGLATSVLNCYVSGVTFNCPNITDNSLSVGGISGGVYSNQTYDICYANDLSFNFGVGEKAIGTSITSRYNNTGAFANSITNCFGPDTMPLCIYAGGSFSAAGNNCGNNTNEKIADMAADAFLTKLNAAKAAYTGGKATLVDWVRGTDGYPTLSGILADPDAAK